MKGSLKWIKYPHHLPSLPHSIDTIFEAAQWILRAPATQTTIPTIPMLLMIPMLPTPTPAIPIAPQAMASLPSDSAFVKTAQFDAILSTIVQIVTTAAISKPDVVPTDSSCPASPEVPRAKSAPSAPIKSTPAPATVPTVSSPTVTAPITTHSTAPVPSAAHPTASAPIETMTLAAQEHAQALEEEIHRIHATGHKTEYPRYIMLMIQAQPTISTPAMPLISNRPPSTIDIQPSTSSLASIPRQPIPWKPIAIAKVTTSNRSPSTHSSQIRDQTVDRPIHRSKTIESAPVVSTFVVVPSPVATAIVTSPETPVAPIVAPLVEPSSAAIAAPASAPVAVPPIVTCRLSSIAAVDPPVVTQIVAASALVPLSLPSRSRSCSPIVDLETSPIVLFAQSSPIELPPTTTPAPVVPAIILYVLVALAHTLARLLLRPPPYSDEQG